MQETINALLDKEADQLASVRQVRTHRRAPGVPQRPPRPPQEEACREPRRGGALRGEAARRDLHDPDYRALPKARELGGGGNDGDAPPLAVAARVMRDGVAEALAYARFPMEHWKRIRTNNGIERLNRGSRVARTRPSATRTAAPRSCSRPSGASVSPTGAGGR